MKKILLIKLFLFAIWIPLVCAQDAGEGGRTCAMPDDEVISVEESSPAIAFVDMTPDDAIKQLVASPAWNAECSEAEARNRDALLAAYEAMPEDQKRVAASILRRLPYSYSEAIESENLDEEFGNHRLTFIPDHLRMDAESFCDHVRISLEAREKMPWCADLSEVDFLHYVTPHRGTGEDLENWRKFFWNDEELQSKTAAYAREYREAGSPEEKSAVFVRLVHYLNSVYLAGHCKYKPRGMPDLTPSQLFESGIGRCTDLTNALMAICRSYGICTVGVRTIWWPRADSNHYWAAVKDPINGKWYDIDGALGGELTPGYLTVGRHGNEFHAKVYWVDWDAVQGPIRTMLDGEEIHPWAVQHYLQLLPMVDKTELYTPVGEITRKTSLKENTPVYLCCWNSDAWQEVAAARVDKQGVISFEKVGCRDGILYLMMRMDDEGHLTPVGRPGILTSDTFGATWKDF